MLHSISISLCVHCYVGFKILISPYICMYSQKPVKGNDHIYHILQGHTFLVWEMHSFCWIQPKMLRVVPFWLLLVLKHSKAIVVVIVFKQTTDIFAYILICLYKYHVVLLQHQPRTYLFMPVVYKAIVIGWQNPTMLLKSHHINLNKSSTCCVRYSAF